MQAGGGMQGGMGQPSQPFGMGGGDDAGAMGGGGGQADYGFQPFDSSFGSDAGGQDMYGGEMQSMPLGDDDDGDDLPLLEDLGINFEHIKKKTAAVLMPNQLLPEDILEDRDFAGPLVICVCLGFSLLLTGKVHFGYIYGIGAMGCIGMYCVLNLMTGSGPAGMGGHRHKGVDLMRVFSIQGYCLLPITAVAAVGIVFDLRGWLGTILSLAAIVWCTVTSTRFFEQAMDAKSQRYLIAYPVFLQFACFALITVF